MSQIKVTPSFLIQLMQNSRGLSDKSLMSIIDVLKTKDGVLTADDIRSLFRTEEDTVVPIKMEGKSKWVKERNDYKNEVAEFLSDYLSKMNQNLTDQEVYSLYEKLLDMAVKEGEANEMNMFHHLNHYLKNYSSDVSTLSNEEVKNIVDQQQTNEFEEKVLIQNWPEKPTYNVFEKEEEKE